jgi:hypothetical protein
MKEVEGTIEDLRYWAKDLAGRPVEVEKLPTGKHIVMWMAFERPPPPQGDTEEGALKNFISMMLQLKDTKDKIFDTEDAEIVKKEILDGIKTRYP